MNRTVLSLYQLLIGISDTSTGAMLVFAPEFTLRLMFLKAPDDAQIYISFVGAFVFSVGLACLYGAYLIYQKQLGRRIETVWLLTAITRGSVALFVAVQVGLHSLAAGWLIVALMDGACVVIQISGLSRGWLTNEPL